ADVVALAVLGRGIVDLEEELEDVPVGDPLRVEDDLHRLGVTGVIAVGRMVVAAAGVADAGRDDPVLVAQQLLNAPEAASRENRGLGAIAHSLHSTNGHTWGVSATRLVLLQLLGMALFIIGVQGGVRLLFDSDDAGLMGWVPGGWPVQLFMNFVVV